MATRFWESGRAQTRPLYHKVFAALPFEHAESRQLQAKSVEVFKQIAEEASDELAAQAEDFVRYAEQHKVIVDRFGRFPHRNVFIGRPSHPEELEFLKQPGSSF